MVVKVRVPDDGSSVSPRALLGVGTQILDHSVDGSPTAKVKLSWTYLTGPYPDGARYELRKQKFQFSSPKALHDAFLRR